MRLTAELVDDALAVALDNYVHAVEHMEACAAELERLVKVREHVPRGVPRQRASAE